MKTKQKKNRKKKKQEEKKENKSDKKKNKWWLILIGIIVIALIVVLLIFFLGSGKKYKITLHYGDETIEVDKNFKLSDLEVDGGTISFLADSDGNVVLPGDKLDSSKEYSAHVIPDGKENVKVTYKIDSKKQTIVYQKGAGLLFPKTPTKNGYVFVAWKYEDKDDYPVYMMPVNEDMTIVAVFQKSKTEGGKCSLNCDTNKDKICDLNCDRNGDGKPDTNIDTDGDGKPDLNITTGRNGSPNRNVDKDGDGKCDYNCDTNNDGICDENCKDEEYMPMNYIESTYTFYCSAIKAHEDYITTARAWYDQNYEFVSLEIDGKSIPESAFETSGNIKYYDYGKDYLGTGKTMHMYYRVIHKDKTGQKYYYIFIKEFYFEGNCDSKKNDDYPIKTKDWESLTLQCWQPAFGITYGDWAERNAKEYKYISFTVNGKEIKMKSDDGKTALWDIEDYRAKGDSVKIVVKSYIEDKKGNKYYQIENIPLSFEKNCNKEDTKKDESKKDETKKDNSSSTQTTTPQVDNGKISISLAKSCLVNGQSTTVNANVIDAKDSNVDWLVDMCLSVSSQGHTATITANNCSSNPKITGRLSNGASDSKSISYENSLIVTVKDSSGNTVNPTNEVYKGNKLTIYTNVPATITGNYLSGDAGSLRTSASTTGAASTTVIILTPCGQSRTFDIEAIIY